jgi:hypothetical protein
MVAMIVVAAAAVATLVVLGARTGGPRGGTALGGSSAPSATSAAPAPGTGTRGQPGQPTAAQLERFVRDYYALLPGQPAAAWAMLGERARAASDGYQNYVNFYNSLESVSFAEPPVAVDRRTVRAALRFVPKSGGQTVERYQFTVEPGPNGNLIMTSFSHG